MAKLTLSDVNNILGSPTSAQTTINNNSRLIETALENTLSRDGTTPNQMLADIDLNENDLLNVGLLDTETLVLNGTTVGTEDTPLVILDEVLEARDQAQAWAEGTLPGGPGTKSSREWAEVAQSAAVSAIKTVDSFVTAPTLIVDTNVQIVQTFGYYTAGDLGAARYKRVSSDPGHAAKFQTANSVWFELEEPSPNILQFGARAGSSTYAAANVTSINAAISFVSSKGGGTLKGASGVFYINAPITFQGMVGVYIDGLKKSTIFKLSTPFTGNELITMRGTRNIIADSVLDCSAVATASTWLSGVRAENESTIDCGVKGCEIKDASFSGIWMNDSLGTYTHQGFFAEGNIVTNVGWMGIAFIGTIDGHISNNNVSRTGFTAIWADERNVGLKIVKNKVSKATAPYRIYDGPGSVGGVEKGFMIGYAPSNRDTLIADNRCIDNRNAAEDGIGLGEDGTEHGPCIIRNNFVQYAGLFGIDVASRATVTGNRIEEPAQSGIFMALDLGGSIAQSVVTHNTIRSCNGPYAIQISSNMGNPLTIADCEISDNIIVDYRGTPATQYGIRINKTNLTITNLKMNNNIAVNIGGTQGFLYDGTGTDWPIFASGNQWKNSRKAVNGNFSVTGYEAFTLTNAGATDFTQMTGGYEGKEVNIYFNDGNTTLKPDWLNSLGLGTNRIIGNGNVARVMAAGDAAKLQYRSGVGWQLISITDSY